MHKKKPSKEFLNKKKRTFHITTATHDSRTSQRMIDYKVRLRRDNGMRPYAQPIWLESKDELLITEVVAEIVKEDKLNILAYNICGDHMHILLVCKKEEVTKIIQKIKSITAKLYNRSVGKTLLSMEHAPLARSNETKGPVKNAPLAKQKHISLWTQKFGCKEIKDENYLFNAIKYIKTNRDKHKLPLIDMNNGKGTFEELREEICCSIKYAFSNEYK